MNNCVVNSDALKQNGTENWEKGRLKLNHPLSVVRFFCRLYFFSIMSHYTHKMLRECLCVSEEVYQNHKDKIILKPQRCSYGKHKAEEDRDKTIVKMVTSENTQRMTSRQTKVLFR